MCSGAEGATKILRVKICAGPFLFSKATLQWHRQRSGRTPGGSTGTPSSPAGSGRTLAGRWSWPPDLYFLQAWLDILVKFWHFGYFDPIFRVKKPKGSKWAIFDFSRFSSQIGVVGHMLGQIWKFGQILTFRPFDPIFGGRKFSIFLCQKTFSKQFSNFFSNFYLSRIHSECSKWCFLAICCETPYDRTFRLQPALDYM